MNKSEDSQPEEGLNVFWFLIHNGIPVKRNSLGKAEQVKVKEQERLKEYYILATCNEPYSK